MAGLAAAVCGAVVFGIGRLSVDAGWVVGILLFGPLVGVLQWLSFRGDLPQSGWWVLVTTVGWIAAGPAMGLVSAIVSVPLGGWVGLGAVFGATTGFVLARWLVPPGGSTASLA